MKTLRMITPMDRRAKRDCGSPVLVGLVKISLYLRTLEVFLAVCAVYSIVPKDGMGFGKSGYTVEHQPTPYPGDRHKGTLCG